MMMTMIKIMNIMLIKLMMMMIMMTMINMMTVTQLTRNHKVWKAAVDVQPCHAKCYQERKLAQHLGGPRQPCQAKRSLERKVAQHAEAQYHARAIAEHDLHHACTMHANASQCGHRDMQKHLSS